MINKAGHLPRLILVGSSVIQKALFYPRFSAGQISLVYVDVRLIECGFGEDLCAYSA